MNELHLFAGIGGGILGGILLGHTCVCAVEIEPYCRQVLLQRQRDGILPRFPLWDDVRTFSGIPWRGQVDGVCGGFPCQDISAAGKGAGITGAKSGIWAEMARIIGEVRPHYAFVENSPMLTARGLGRVLGDLAEMGYDARWGVISAADAGAPHLRKRIWILAHAVCDGRQADHGRESVSDFDRISAASAGGRPQFKQGPGCTGLDPDAHRERQPQPGGPFAELGGWPGDLGKKTVSNAHRQGLPERKGIAGNPCEELPASVGTGGWAAEPDVGRVVDELPDRVDRLRGLGNAQVPAVVALAWRTLMEAIENE